jgi:hypothetical protein
MCNARSNVPNTYSIRVTLEGDCCSVLAVGLKDTISSCSLILDLVSARELARLRLALRCNPCQRDGEVEGHLNIAPSCRFRHPCAIVGNDLKRGVESPADGKGRDRCVGPALAHFTVGDAAVLEPNGAEGPCEEKVKCEHVGDYRTVV